MFHSSESLMWEMLLSRSTSSCEPVSRPVIPTSVPNAFPHLDAGVSDAGNRSWISGKNGSISLLSNHMEPHFKHPSISIDESLLVETGPLTISPWQVGHRYPALCPLKTPLRRFLSDVCLMLPFSHLSLARIPKQ